MGRAVHVVSATELKEIVAPRKEVGFLLATLLVCFLTIPLCVAAAVVAHRRGIDSQRPTITTLEENNASLASEKNEFQKEADRYRASAEMYAAYANELATLILKLNARLKEVEAKNATFQSFFRKYKGRIVIVQRPEFEQQEFGGDPNFNWDIPKNELPIGGASQQAPNSINVPWQQEHP